MAPWQFLTVLTLGVALAITLASVALAAAVFLSPSAHVGLVYALHGAAEGIPRGWLAVLIAGGGIATAVGLVKAQQGLAALLVHRELGKLRRMHEEIAVALGTEKADEFVRFKVGRIQEQTERSRLNIFG